MRLVTNRRQTLLYLIRRSYAYIYALLISSEPVSEALLPVYNQLQTLRRCLLEVKESGGVSNSRELYPYSMKVSNLQLPCKAQKLTSYSSTPLTTCELTANFTWETTFLKDRAALMRCWLNAMILYGSCARLYLTTEREKALNSLLVIFLYLVPFFFVSTA
jgi:hypothetical protein